MLIYRFRVLFSEEEDFVRDIDISSNCTFLDLHQFFLETIKFDGKELASFFIADSQWNKNEEITLIDMQIGDEPAITMHDTNLSDYINEPHQRLLYEYDFLNIHTFFFELIDIIDSENHARKNGYPSLVYSKGTVDYQDNSVDDLLMADLISDYEKVTAPEFDIMENDDISRMFEDLQSDEPNYGHEN
ncbi:MAG: hypothetical protein JEZ03_08095 [Bacteroidales bacterium]|nr:hypothetical protein [Bacteroidales bacterium]